MSEIYYNDAGRIDLLQDILENGVFVPDRTGVNCMAVFDRKLIFNVGEQFPFSTFSPAPLRMAFEEFWFFLNGETQTKKLEEKGINFWKGNTSREFLDKRGLSHLHEGDMGKAYGAQFRGFGSSHFDQIESTFDVLSKDKYSRRLLNTIWNPEESHMMALTPCWHSHQFVVLPDENGVDTLHMKLINRSLDALFGERYATQQYALYMVAVAACFGLKVGNLSCDLTHAHLYMNQLEYAKEMTQRAEGVGGVLEIKKDLQSLDDVLSMEWSDIEVTGLTVNNQPFKAERPAMAV